MVRETRLRFLVGVNKIYIKMTTKRCRSGLGTDMRSTRVVIARDSAEWLKMCKGGEVSKVCVDHSEEFYTARVWVDSSLRSSIERFKLNK